MTRLNVHHNLLITPYNGDQQHDWQDLIFHWRTLHNGANTTTGSSARCGTSHSTGPSSTGVKVTHGASPYTRLQPCRISTPLRTRGCPGRTHSPAALPNLHASPDKRLPRTDSLACSLAGSPRLSGQQAAQNGHTRLQLHRITRRIFADRLPRHPNASSGRQRHIVPDRLARRRTDPARHRQHNSPTPQSSSLPVVSLPFPYSVLRLTSQLSFLCLHTSPRTDSDNSRLAVTAYSVLRLSPQQYPLSLVSDPHTSLN